MRIRYMGELRALRLTPDDIIVLIYYGELSDAEAKKFRTFTMRNLKSRGIHNDCMVLSGGFKLGLLRKTKP